MDLFYVKAHKGTTTVKAVVEGKTAVEALNNFHKSDFVQFDDYEIVKIDYGVDKNGNSSNVVKIKL